MDASDALEDRRVIVWPAATAAATSLALALSLALASFLSFSFAFLCVLFGAYEVGFGLGCN